MSSNKKKVSKGKAPTDMTDAELMRRVFPKPIRDAIKGEAQGSDRKGRKVKGGAHGD